MVAYDPSPDFDVPSLNVARPIAVARRTLPWLVGPAVVLLRSRSLELAGASACPGLLELTSIGVVRLRPDLPVGELFVALQFVVMAAALAAFIAFVRRHTRRLWIAVAAATAVGVGPLLPSVVAPPWDAAAFGMAAAVALVVATYVDDRRPSPSAIRAVTVVAGSAGLLLVPLWLLAGPPSTGALGACAMPAVSAARAVEIFASAASWLGPFAMGLAALGAFTAVGSVNRRELLIVAAAAIVAVVAASGTALSRPVVAAPLAFLLWSLAAIGLEQVVRAAGTTMPARIAGVLIVVVLPALSASRRLNEERDDWIRPRGHQQQTLRGMTRVLNLVPQATFVEEDATVDVLLRAASFGGRRKAKPITIVAATADAVGRAMASQPVYAFPRRQDDLGLRGFVVEPLSAAYGRGDSEHAIDGVARITGRRTCQRIGPTWANFDGEEERFALSADSEAARGPVVIYFGGASAGAPEPDGWSARMLRGFGYIRLDRLTPAGVERMRAEARGAGLPDTHPVFAEPFVIRFNLHRTPRAPLALPIRLGARFPVALVKLDERALDVGRLVICDAPPAPASALPPQD